MKAIILAAGESTRMWPLAIRKNKCMYEFLGKPLLQYTLEGLRKFGIRDIIIVRSASDDSIAKALGNGTHNTALHFIVFVHGGGK